MISGTRHKRVLFVAYDFPPRRTSGIYRATRMANYLVDHGWIPTVLTVKTQDGEYEDPTLLRNLRKEIRIERIKDLDVTAWEEGAAEGIRAAGGLKSRNDDKKQPLRDRFVRLVGDLIRSTLYFPDRFVGWIPGATTRAIELHMLQRFDLVYTTSPPRSANLVGYLLKVLFNLPWVAEFRDPWYPASRQLRQAANQKLYSMLLKTADTIVAVAKGNAGDIQSRLPEQSGKVQVIHNGFNEEDFERDNEKSDLLSADFIHFSHIGTIYPGFSGKFFEALDDLIREFPDLRKRIRVNIIGFPDEIVQKYVETGECRDLVQVHGFLEHDITLRVMRASDCLLLFLANPLFASMTVSGKTYEYLRIGRPILAIVPHGELIEMIRDGNAGWAVGPEDKAAIKRAMMEVIRNAPQPVPKLPPRPDYVSQFRSDRLAARLAKVFDTVSGQELQSAGLPRIAPPAQPAESGLQFVRAGELHDAAGRAPARDEQMPAPKRVLLVTLDFPPRRTSGVYRTVAFAKYLVDHGWESTVLTAQKIKAGAMDSELLKRFPSKLRIAGARFLSISGWEESAALRIRSIGGLQSKPGDRKQPLFDRTIRRIGRFIRSAFYFPDDSIGWFPLAVLKAIALHREKPFDVMWTVGPPRAAQVVGYWVKTLLNIPWVAEFHDPWYPPESRLRARLERWAQLLLFRKADVMLLIADGYSRELQSAYGTSQEKIRVISSGFDEEFHAEVAQPAKCDWLPPGFLHLTHFGTIYNKFAGKFYDALLELLTEHPELKNRLRVNIVGFPDQDALTFSTHPELKDVLRIHPFITYSESLEAMQASHCLLLFLGNRDVSRLTVPGKLFDYLRSRRPILALTYDGGTRKIIENGNLGWAMGPDDLPQIKKVLSEICEADRPDAFAVSPPPGYVDQFRYDRLTGQLAGLLEEVSRRDK